MSFIDELPKHTILLTRAGSRVYGINTATSDVDIKGICVPTEEYIFGTEVFEQADKPMHMAKFFHLLTPEEQKIAQDEKLEGTVYDARKFIKLALDANPNILDVLFCRDQDVLLSTPAGELLRENRDLFLSAKAKHTFSGYAVAQMKRIRTHRAWLLNPPTHKPTRTEFGLPEFSLIPPDQLRGVESMIKAKLDSWEVDMSSVESEAERIALMGRFQDVLSEIFAASMRPTLFERIKNTVLRRVPTFDERVAKWKASVRSLGIDDNMLLILDRERRYKGAMNNWHQYEEWRTNRNKDRASLEAKYGYDTKHGAHLVRLMRMGEEVLTTGKVNVWRGDIDAEELRSIRAGAWDYDKIDEFATAAEAKLDAIYNSKSYVVPHAPKRNKVVELSVKVVQNKLNGGRT